MPNRGNRPGDHEADDDFVDMNDPNAAKCCVPLTCNVGELIRLDDLSECVKVICNNEQCQEGRYMHKECFEVWEETVLTFLRSTGRARSWSEKQRLQNLWTKKGYDLAYKACGCKCGKGHLRKDLDWIAPSAPKEEQRKKKKNRRKRANDKPSLIISTSVPATHGAPTRQTSNANGTGNGNCAVVPLPRNRTSSMSSTGSMGSGNTTPPMSGSEAHSPGFTDGTFSCWQKFMFGNPNRRERSNSGSIFNRRHDYSSFNTLPRHKINSYHIKMEDDVNHGNDETRCFLLSTLSANRMNRTSCILCDGTLNIFDRYPLIDGTFFISPRQHSPSAVPVKWLGERQYLNAICMGCLEGWNVSIYCRNCKTKWNGSHLILGSMYSYDIFAAVPCCAERFRCNNCDEYVIPEERLEFFSDYSRIQNCKKCKCEDHHYVKPLQVTYLLSEAN
ncbi:Headcase-like protein [Dinothrombium tinctorium]|uniref:Headcase-like protein n=1 Tax=Dinothrombium tinctorium TaxID=1965070 RepID=A0A3S3QMW5_9ACAR|nr:Headcase-like protein [Dinothrombium tinctorium]